MRIANWISRTSHKFVYGWVFPRNTVYGLKIVSVLSLFGYFAQHFDEPSASWRMLSNRKYLLTCVGLRFLLVSSDGYTIRVVFDWSFRPTGGLSALKSWSFEFCVTAKPIIEESRKNLTAIIFCFNLNPRLYSLTVNLQLNIKEKNGRNESSRESTQFERCERTRKRKTRILNMNSVEYEK